VSDQTLFEQPGTALAKAPVQAITPTTPMALLQLAIEREGSIDVIERLAKLQQDFLDREAKIAFAHAIEEFKANLPIIVKDKKVFYKGKEGKPDTQYYHVELDKACDLLVPALLKVGLTHRWASSTLPGGGIVVTCYLKHRLGYEEAGSSLPGNADLSGGKNSIQAIGSTLTYLERYTLLSTCGIAPKGIDDDGRDSSGNQPGKLAETVALIHEENINNAGCVDDLKRFYFAALGEADAVGDNSAKNIFGKLKDARYKQLHLEGRK
jgi:hypothetical protein